MDNRDKLYFNKYCYLQYLCCLLCNPATRVNQIKGSDTLKYMRASKKLISTRSINTSISSVRTSATININTGKGTHLFFVSTPGINAEITYIRNNDNIRISLFDSLFLCCVSSVADGLAKHVLVVFMLLV